MLSWEVKAGRDKGKEERGKEDDVRGLGRGGGRGRDR